MVLSLYYCGRVQLSKSKDPTSEILLVNKLLGSKAKSIRGQLVVKYINYDTVNIALYRKLHCGLPDIEFSVADTDLPEILELLTEAKQKIDSYWLSKNAIARTKVGNPETKKKKNYGSGRDR